jgi:hypothetical protein
MENTKTKQNLECVWKENNYNQKKHMSFIS